MQKQWTILTQFESVELYRLKTISVRCVLTTHHVPAGPVVVAAVVELGPARHGWCGSEQGHVMLQLTRAARGTCVSGRCDREAGPEATLSSEPRYSCTSPTSSGSGMKCPWVTASALTSSLARPCPAPGPRTSAAHNKLELGPWGWSVIHNPQKGRIPSSFYDYCVDIFLADIENKFSRFSLNPINPKYTLSYLSYHKHHHSNANVISINCESHNPKNTFKLVCSVEKFWVHWALVSHFIISAKEMSAAKQNTK